MVDMQMTQTPGRVVLGAMDYGTMIGQSRAFEILDRYVERGGEWLDTADCYSFWTDPSGVGGASERVLGAWLRGGGRAAVKIATKVRQNPLVPHDWPASAEGLSPAAIRAGVAGSLERLGIDRIDLLWAHAEDRSVPLGDTVGAFGELVARGTVGRLGAANHASWRVERARTIAHERGVAMWSAVQLRYSLVQPRPGATLPHAGHRLMTPDDLDLAADAGLDVWAYTPLLHGGYVREDRPFVEAYDHPGTPRTLGVLDEVCAELGATRNHVVLAWLMQQGICPIVGASRIEYVDEAMDAQDLTLSAEQLVRLDSAR